MTTLSATNASAELAPRATNKWAVATAVAIGALLEVVDTSIVNVALNDIQTTVGATLSEASWIVSSYAVANVIVLPMTAWLGARFGKKRYFVMSMIGFTLASVLCGMATSLPMLIAARVLQGLMGGGLLAKAQAFLYETFPPEEQALAQGFFGAVVIAGPAIGPTLGGYIVTNYDWRWIFWVNVPVGIAAVLLCLSALPADTGKRDDSSIDWLAIALLAMGLGSLQTLLEEGNSEDWFESKLIVALTVAAVIGICAFVWRELTAERPIVNLRVLRHRSLWAGSLLSVVVGMALYGTLFALPIFAQTIMQYTPEQTGWLLFPGALAAAVTMPLVARLLRKLDARLVLAAGGLVLVMALYSFNALTPATGASDLFWPLLVRSLGTSMMFLPLNLATLGPIPKHQVGEASSFFNLTRQLGGSIGVALLTTLLTDRQAFHRAVLAEKLVPSDPSTLDRLHALSGGLVARGVPATEAPQKALAMLDGILNQQAAVMSFADTFWVTAALILCCLPLVLVLGKAARGETVAAAH